MKKLILICAAAFLSGTTFSYGQDMAQSEVPSVVVNNFEKEFPKAIDVEWELKGNLYKVDFETGMEVDHDAWYTKTGDLKKHKEDISKNELPKSVINTLNTNYKGFRVDDCDKYTEGSTITYKVDVESATQDWKIWFDTNGKELKKVND